MLIKASNFLSGVSFAPSGKAADAGDDGPISDADVEAVDAKEAKGGDEDEFGAGVTDEAVDEVADPEDGDDEGDDETPQYTLADVWKQHGVEGLPDTPDELQSQISELRRQASEGQRYRDYAAMLIQHAQMQAQQQAAAAPRAEQQKPKLPWEVPQFDRRLIDQITTDENGNLVPKPGAMPNVVDDYRKWQSHREQALDKFLQDPVSIIQDVSKDFVEQRAQQIAMQQIDAYRREHELKSFEAENRGWVFEKDGKTLTAAANLWNTHYRQALQLGLPDPIGYAESQLNSEAYRRRLAKDAEHENKETPEDREKEKRLALLRRGSRKPGRGGSLPDKGRKTPPQNSKNIWGALEKRLESIGKADLDDK